MDFEERETDQCSRWLRISLVLAIFALISWYIKHVDLQIVKITNDHINDIDAINNRLNHIISKLGENEHLISDLKSIQRNFQHSVHELIENEITKMYNDKTGRVDYALESAGGKIVQLSPGTKNFDSLLGLSFCDSRHDPRAIIRAGTAPGECWAFQGSTGGVVIKLLGSVKINAVSLEHISKKISPIGECRSAPKEFAVYGLKSIKDRGMFLGQFLYDVNNGPVIQTFELEKKSSDESYKFVELRIISNYGHPEFTCIYRFRVHGMMEN